MDKNIEQSIGNDVTMRSSAAGVLGRVDQYELLRELGGGGFGTVYLAKDTVSGVEVAVKGLPPLVLNNMVSNVLIHREFTSSRPARFIIERDRMFVENACRATNGELVTPDTLEPDPKNPIIAAFFREIAYADQLGSGVKNLYKYAKAYGGSDPAFQDGDMFTISVSLEKLKDSMAGEVAPTGSDVAPTGKQVAQKDMELAQKKEQVAQKLSGKGRVDAVEKAVVVFGLIVESGDFSIADMEKKTGYSNGAVKNALRLLRVNGIIKREGGDHGGKWVVLI